MTRVARFRVLQKIGFAAGALLSCAWMSGQVPARLMEFPAPPDVARPPAGARKLGSGVATEALRSGSGRTRPSGNDCVEVSFLAWKRDGSLAAASGPHGESSIQCLSAAIPGIAIALESMVAGEKRRVWVPADFSVATHMAHHAGHIMHDDETPRTDLTFDLELIRVLQAPPIPPDLTTPPRTAYRTPSGVSIQMLKPGLGAGHPAASSRVTLNYTGWSTDGKVFESTMMSEHPVTVQLGTALPGWREALPYMVLGEKARLWIPAGLAYGDHPSNPMLPAGRLVYDIELVGLQ